MNISQRRKAKVKKNKKLKKESAQRVTALQRFELQAILDKIDIIAAQIEPTLRSQSSSCDRWVAYYTELRDIRDNGIRFDLTPTAPLGDGPAPKLHAFYTEYIKRIDAAMRTRAAVALGETTWQEASGLGMGRTPSVDTAVVVKAPDMPDPNAGHGAGDGFPGSDYP